MMEHPACSVRAALADLRERAPTRCHEYAGTMARTEIAGHFAERHAGTPATGRAGAEDVALYSGVEGAALPVLLGLYGDGARVRGWLPGLPRRVRPDDARRRLAGGPDPVWTGAAPCRQEVWAGPVDLARLPVLTATPRDAGPYVTMGLIHARDPEGGPEGGEDALSVHRMLVTGRDRLTVWMLPGRRLRALYDAATARGIRLPVTVGIGAPPAAVVASALGTAFLPAGTGKLKAAGALAGRPIALAPALTQPAVALAASEIVLEGYFDGTVADEAVPGRDRPSGVSLPEFLGYDGRTKPDVPVMTVTAVTTRRDALYQAVIGPGREQSVVLGIAGALSVGLSLAAEEPALAALVCDLHFPAAGGGMLLLAVGIAKTGPEDDGRLEPLARHVFARHPFVKLIVFADEEIDIANEEDLLWAVVTRSNLRTDCASFADAPNMPMDPSQGAAWLEARGAGDGRAGRSFIDATTPFRLKAETVRSFPWPPSSRWKD